MYSFDMTVFLLIVKNYIYPLLSITFVFSFTDEKFYKQR